MKKYLLIIAMVFGLSNLHAIQLCQQADNIYVTECLIAVSSAVQAIGGGLGNSYFQTISSMGGNTTNSAPTAYNNSITAMKCVLQYITDCATATSSSISGTVTNIRNCMTQV